MAKFIGIDYGTKRVGIAISDETAMIATPLDVIHASQLLDYLRDKKEKENIEALVLGLPVGLKGENTNVTEKIRQIEVHLKRSFPEWQIYLVDERFTSKMAGRAMIEANVPKKKREEKGMLDKISAAILLQSFLDNRKK